MSVFEHHHTNHPSYRESAEVRDERRVDWLLERYDHYAICACLCVFWCVDDLRAHATHGCAALDEEVFG